jgi:predicted DNA-binding protein
MEPNKWQPMTETVSVRLTQDERTTLERLASAEERTVSNYVRKHLRNHLELSKEKSR